METHVDYALLNLPLESSHSQLNITNRKEATDPRTEHLEKKQNKIGIGTIIVVLLMLVIILSCTVGVLAYQMHFGNGKNQWNSECENKSSILSVRDELCITDTNATSDQKNDCKLCPLDWKLFQENCYFISTNEEIKSWKESQAFCIKMNSHLLVLENEEQKDILGKMVDKQASYWIGYYFDNNKKNWTWVTSEFCKDFQFDFKHNSEADQCVVRSNTYISDNCNSPYSWICQRKAIRFLR
ncbi:natural killer cells antigen CD94-like [Anomaloglossus baeobatrachus]|uniref:natural killer cells antigen CD94-like n=1 Tax=Anomaloglossus baeobatrachus TaxID=238106 RepID=UPI003F4F7758